MILPARNAVAPIPAASPKVSAEDLIKLYTEIYRFNVEANLTSIEQLIHDGISAYAGGHPCNQVATGLYITLNGVVLSCPGSEDNIEGNIWQTSLSEIWFNSYNYGRRGTFNCHCIAKDGKSIPSKLYDEVLSNLSKVFGAYCEISDDY